MNVIYIDLIYGNISLNNGLHMKFLNFSSSLLDSFKLFIIVTASHKCPRANLKLTRADLFALSSTLYKI